METYMLLGAALLALLASLPALAYRQHWNVLREFWARPGAVLRELIASDLGAVTVAYYTRGVGVALIGSATPITATQAQQVYMQKALVVFGVAADVQALFTHNWGLDLSSPTFFDPEILLWPISTTTYWPLLTFDLTNTNVVKINKPGTDAGTTVLVTIRRPMSLGQ